MPSRVSRKARDLRAEIIARRPGMTYGEIGAELGIDPSEASAVARAAGEPYVERVDIVRRVTVGLDGAADRALQKMEKKGLSASAAVRRALTAFTKKESVNDGRR